MSDVTKNIKVGFIGLGNIGFPMAKNIVKDGFESYVYDVFDEPKDKLAKKGAISCDSVKQLAESCDVIGVCVRDDKDVESLLYGAEGLLENCSADTIVAIHSTVTQDGLIKWAADGQKQNIHVIDAPITGGAMGAQEKALCYMVGGDESLSDRLNPVLETSARKIIHAGPVGAGMALKLCNNLINYSAFTAIDEALRLAASSGLNPDLVYEVGEVNGIVTAMMKRFASNRDAFKPEMTEEAFAEVFGPFALLAEKDLDAALAVAKQNKVTLPATEKVREGISGVFYKTN